MNCQLIDLSFNLFRRPFKWAGRKLSHRLIFKHKIELKTMNDIMGARFEPVFHWFLEQRGNFVTTLNASS